MQISDSNSMVKKDKDDMILNILNALQHDPGYSIEIRHSIASYLGENWYRQVGGYDVTFYSGREMPGVLASAALKIVHDDLESFREKHIQNVARAKQKIAPGKLDEWLHFMEDAHLCHRLRDERSLYSDVWASGILRRALQVVGQRVLDTQELHWGERMLHELDHILFITEEELTALFCKVDDRDKTQPLRNGLANKLRQRSVFQTPICMPLRQLMGHILVPQRIYRDC